MVHSFQVILIVHFYYINYVQNIAQLNCNDSRYLINNNMNQNEIYLKLDYGGTDRYKNPRFTLILNENDTEIPVYLRSYISGYIRQ